MRPILHKYDNIENRNPNQVHLQDNIHEKSPVRYDSHPTLSGFLCDYVG